MSEKKENSREAAVFTPCAQAAELLARRACMAASRQALLLVAVRPCAAHAPPHSSHVPPAICGMRSRRLGPPHAPRLLSMHAGRSPGSRAARVRGVATTACSTPGGRRPNKNVVGGRGTGHADARACGRRFAACGGQSRRAAAVAGAGCNHEQQQISAQCQCALTRERELPHDNMGRSRVCWAERGRSRSGYRPAAAC